ncbi:MAG: CPBP family intramembrane metalloprotease [Erysipelotrichaceae bacterium]|nr:CPBP family intramembrane metalloprotease [Erysipelotrichaceae bacterium]
MSKKRSIIVCVLIACLLMAWVDGSSLDYVTKAILKILTFSLIPLFYFRLLEKSSIRSLFQIKHTGLKVALILGLSSYALIIVIYFSFGYFFDLTLVSKILEDNFGSGTLNFVPIAFYIAMINSFLEEFFFRGFAYLALVKVSSRRFASIFSSIMFALYHVFLMYGLFPFWLYISALGLMIIAGVLFNALDQPSKTILPSWLFHSLTNWGINTIGFILLKII